MRTCVLCAALVVGGHVSAAVAQTLEVGIIDFYGLREVAEKDLRGALGVSEGAQLDREDWAASKSDVVARLEALTNVVAARIQAVCCDEGKVTLYLGIQEDARTVFELHPAPQADVVLPDEIVATGERFAQAMMEAIQAGDSGDDMSQGHSLVSNPVMRAEQEKLLVYAEEYRQIIRDVLRKAADDDQRAIAAWTLGYAADKASVVDDLLYAVRDSNEVVRNNATRALAAIAQLGQAQPALGIEIPFEPFIDMLNSIEWSDRNKAGFVLRTLTETGDPELLEQLRERTLESLAEMAQWKSSGHAMAYFLILGRIAGMSDEEIFEAFSTGGRAEAVNALLELIGAHGPLKPRLRLAR